MQFALTETREFGLQHNAAKQAGAPMRRAATTVIVLLLHVLVVLALLAAFRPQLLTRVVGSREIVISLPVTQERRSRQQPNEVPPPAFLPPEVSRPITPPILEGAPAMPARPSQSPGDMEALGRYLYNCTGANYERLSPKEKAHCLENKWNGETGPSLTLGPAKPSPYDAVIAGRNAPAVPFERPCSTDKPTANLGLPCHDFDNAHAPLVEFRH
ncbi:MAG: hypothetical protein JO056_13335 [Alphaproteobacteria bacterium]|nr:hypothetical protein [Alphaproteobacteria bacterium]